MNLFRFKKSMFLFLNILVLLLIMGCDRPATYDEQIPMEDIKQYAEDEYQIVEWYNDEYQITNEDFAENKKIESVISSFNEPAYFSEYANNHLYLLRIAKDTNGNFKYIIYNRDVKDGTKIKDAVTFLDYDLPYNFDDLNSIANQIKNEYYKDIIQHKQLLLDIEKMIDGQFELFINHTIDDELVNYYTMKIFFDTIDGEKILKIKAQKNHDNAFETIYSSTKQTIVNRIEIDMDNFDDYFEYGISNKVIDIDESGEAIPYASQYLDITPTNEIYYFNINTNLKIIGLNNQNTLETAGYMYKEIQIKNESQTPLYWYFRYDNYIEKEIELIPYLEDVEGFAYIIIEMR